MVIMKNTGEATHTLLFNFITPYDVPGMDHWKSRGKLKSRPTVFPPALRQNLYFHDNWEDHWAPPRTLIQHFGQIIFDPHFQRRPIMDILLRTVF